MSTKFSHLQLIDPFIDFYCNHLDLLEKRFTDHILKNQTKINEYARLKQDPDFNLLDLIQNHFSLECKLSDNQLNSILNDLHETELTNQNRLKVIYHAIQDDYVKISQLNMTNAPYHYGVKLPITFTNKQYRKISANDKARRLTYNNMVKYTQGAPYHKSKSGFNGIFQLQKITNGSYKIQRKLVEAPTMQDLRAKIKCPKNKQLKIVTFGFNHVSNQWYCIFNVLTDARKAKYTHNCIDENRDYIIHHKGEYLAPIQHGIEIAKIQDDYFEYQTLTRYASTAFITKYPIQKHDLDSCSINQAIQNYNKAWKQATKIGSGFPQFKHYNPYEKHYQTISIDKHLNSDLMFGNCAILDQTHMKLPKIGTIKLTRMPNWLWTRHHNVIAGTITIHTNDNNHGYVSIQLASNTPFLEHATYPKTNKAVGIDVNEKNFFATSDNYVAPNHRYLKKMMKKLNKAQRKLSLKQSRAKAENAKLQTRKRYQRQRKHVNRLHKHVANQRMNNVYQQVKTLLNKYDVIVAENLSSKQLINWGHQTGSLMDTAWYQLMNVLSYKCELAGKTFMRVPAKNTTQMCHVCGYICGSDDRHEKLTPKDRKWTCPNCHAHLNRDQNAATNIRNKGLKLLEKDDA